MNVRKLIAAAVMAEVLGLSACGTQAPPITDQNRQIADMTWEVTSSTDRIAICSVLTDGVDDPEVSAFLSGADYQFSEDEARSMLEYLAEEKC